MCKSFSSDRKVLEDAFHEVKKYTHLKVSFGSKAVTRKRPLLAESGRSRSTTFGQK